MKEFWRSQLLKKLVISKELLESGTPCIALLALFNQVFWRNRTCPILFETKFSYIVWYFKIFVVKYCYNPWVLKVLLRALHEIYNIMILYLIHKRQIFSTLKIDQNVYNA